MTTQGELTECPRCGTRADLHAPGRCLDVWIADLLGWQEVGMVPWYSEALSPAWDLIVLLAVMRMEVRTLVEAGVVHVTVEPTGHGPCIRAALRDAEPNRAWCGAVAMAALRAMVTWPERLAEFVEDRP